MASDAGALADASQLVAFAHLALTTAAHVQVSPARPRLLALLYTPLHRRASPHTHLHRRASPYSP